MFWEFITNNAFSLLTLLAMSGFIATSIILIIQIIKLLKKLDDNGVQRNNISEILNVQRMILNKLNPNNNEIVQNTEEKQTNDILNANIRKEKYSQNEMEKLIVDLMLELRKTIKSLNSWRGFGILIILAIIAFFIYAYLAI
jgi:hypothetical protein